MGSSDSASSSPPAVRRLRRFLWKLLFLLVVVAVIAAVGGAWLYRETKEREKLAEELKKTMAELESVKKEKAASGAGTGGVVSRGDEELARQVLAGLGRHIVIAPSPAPTVATIMDVEALKKESNFYEAAQNGDYLVISGRFIMLYDADDDIILNIAPIPPESGASAQTEQQASPLPAGGEEEQAGQQQEERAEETP